MTHYLYLLRHGEASLIDGQLSEVGREQAQHARQRLLPVPLTAIWHGPLPRAAQTATIVAEGFAGIPITVSDRAGDYIPSDPDPASLPPDFTRLVTSYAAAEREHGVKLAAAAIEQFTNPSQGDSDTHYLVVTHNFLIGWFVAWAMDAPPWRWMGLNQMNGALTVIACQPTSPPRLISFNDAAHLPPALRWTGFPPTATPMTG